MVVNVLMLKVNAEVAARLGQEPTAKARRPGTDVGPAAETARAIVKLIHRAGARIAPTHPGVTDPSLSTSFTIEGLDREALGALAERLRALSGVEGAYVKPADELP
jgi:hypothetical protein